MSRKVELQLSRFQKEFINRKDDPLCILCTGISAGKTRAAAVWVVLECLSKKTRIIAAAQNYKALSEVLFREIKLLLDMMKVEYHYVTGNKFTLSNGSEIFGATNENPTSVLGFSDIDGAIIDEAAYTSEELYHYIGDRLRGANIKTPKMRLITSPSNQSKAKWFRDICMKHPEAVIHATALDNPFTSKEFKQSLKDRYGEGSPLYRQQVLGEFIETDSSDTLLKWDEIGVESKGNNQEYYIGVDMARFGVDRTVIILRDGYQILKKVILHQADTFRVSSEVHKLYNECNNRIKATYIDGTGGFGGGITDILRQDYDNVYEINFGSKSYDNLCTNMRSYMYRKLSMAIKDGFYVGNDKDLIEELLAQRIKLNDRGLFQLVSKDEIKEQIGRSPDISDALALTFASNDNEDEMVVDRKTLHNLTNFFFS